VGNPFDPWGREGKFCHKKAQKNIFRSLRLCEAFFEPFLPRFLR